ncbi:MAG: hypothetical protein GY917_19135, partial [Planctomycetaceae bacterium]|nr:hypothetical protein [Planctomycetaceae bacterium]
MLRHIEVDSIKDEMRDMEQAFRNAALFPPVGIAAVPIPGNWVQQIWARVDQLGNLPVSGLTNSNRDDDWTSAGLPKVGITKETPRDFYRYLRKINRERTVPKTNVEINLKFCKSFTFPVDVKTIMTDDMQIPKFLHAAGPLAGQPDLDRLVDHVEERWHLAWDRHEIKY